MGAKKVEPKKEWDKVTETIEKKVDEKDTARLTKEAKEAHQSLTSLERKKKEVTDKLKAEIALQKDKRDVSLSILNRGFFDLTVACYRSVDKDGFTRFYSIDDGELLYERPSQDRDRQKKMSFIDGAQTATA